ncbi:Protein cc2d2b, partial [Rhizophlyctis rosea]
VWTNIQKDSDPGRISFDFNDASKWRPLFTSKFPKSDGASVQLETIPYTPAPIEKRLKHLEETLERTLVAHIEKWRGETPTRWNRLTSRTLRQILTTLEPSPPPPPSPSPSSPTPQQPLENRDLKTLRTMYTLSGSPQNFPYTDLRGAVDKIHACDVHSCGDPECEFALAVRCVGYAGGVVSVWCWVVSLRRKV